MICGKFKSKFNDKCRWIAWGLFEIFHTLNTFGIEKSTWFWTKMLITFPADGSFCRAQIASHLFLKSWLRGLIKLFLLGKILKECVGAWLIYLSWRKARVYFKKVGREFENVHQMMNNKKLYTRPKAKALRNRKDTYSPILGRHNSITVWKNFSWKGCVIGVH